MDKIKKSCLHRKQFKNLQYFTQIVNREENKWPSEPINKYIHMIWIGPKNISDKNIRLSLQTAQKNPDYSTTIIYDSGISGYEAARNFMAEKFKASRITLVDIRNKGYFHQLQQEPSFTYYEEVIRNKKFAQASDILRLLVLKYEGGIYKDIDDIQIKGFGSLAFPKGIGVMREYAPKAGKSAAFPNSPIAATKNNPVVNKTLELAVENYRHGEKNVLKLAGPDVFTKALYQEIPGMCSQVLGTQLEQFELAKRQALRMPLEKPKSFIDEQLTLQEKAKISRPYKAIRGLSEYVCNGADHSWATDMLGSSTKMY
ncbi:TcdA/TcdB catalytic glycosyltransferase domain-containing protein [Yersinia enterocolitica]|uniref:TcdA/TcdB catalytic glycosyltransferase domain-containing protein n=1 Tax=Yersinia enterocolitica TaxID=630 RepID=UPI003F44DEE4